MYKRQEECRRIYGERDDLIYCTNQHEALQNADALIVVTEWQMFRSPDFDAVKQSLKSPVVFDGRNIFDPERLRADGFAYYAIGRGE